MTQLTPALAAAAATGVYGLRTTDMAGLAARGRTLGTEAFFDITSNTPISGRAGISMFRTTSGFGYLARGKANTPYEGDLLLVTRGTYKTSVEDWLTNLTIAMEVGPGGALVHAGFNRLRETMQSQIDQSLRAAGPFRRIHIVGHSLGGALATLNGATLIARGERRVSIYTFGAPRVGNWAFVRWLDNNIGSENIRRVFHPADPVPMIPLFPFFHAPPGDAFALPNTDGGIINPKYHGMDDSYVPGVGEMSWSGLSVVGQEPDSGIKLQRWLAEGGVTNGFVMGSARLLGLIGDALAWILKRAAQVVVGSVLTVGATLLDRIASVLAAGVEASLELSAYISTLVRAIFKFLGRAATAAKDLSRAFLRWVLELLFRAVVSTARHALDRLGD
ncbi:lipase family protein [Sandarakinorhabdus oryzae]|uniref:lipase family protein n=1 Tax=Sandarakinorhabdus oryzae TaxID=2675220 RepID=UPI0012E22BBF|nr:lipase family protein [Sandarakinorhabdus oryzae]